MRMLSLLGLLLALAGCAALGPQFGQAARVDRMLSDVLQLRAAPEAAQRSELAHAREAFASGRGDLQRLRLATLLATLPAPLRDDARAAALLAPLTERAPDTPVARFADLLASQLAARRRLELAARRERRALHETQARAQDLRRELEELQSIERSALRREERLRIE